MHSFIRARRTFMMSYSNVETPENTGFRASVHTHIRTELLIPAVLFISINFSCAARPAVVYQPFIKVTYPFFSTTDGLCRRGPLGPDNPGKKVSQLFDRLQQLLLLFDYLAISFWHVAVGSWKEGKWTWNWETSAYSPSSLIGTITHVRRVDIWRSPGSFITCTFAPLMQKMIICLVSLIQHSKCQTIIQKRF